MRKPAGLLWNGSTEGAGPKLHLIGEELEEGGRLRLADATVTVVIKRSHERFLPPGFNKCAVLWEQHLIAVHDSWAAFLAEDKAHGKDSAGREPTPVAFFFDTFYSKLFFAAPKLASILGDNMVRQSRTLVRMTCECAGLLESLTIGKGLGGLESVARDNIGVGLRAEHYEPIASTLLQALETCLGEQAWTAPVAQSWLRVVALFVNVSVSATVAALEARAPPESEADQLLAYAAFRARASPPSPLPATPPLSPPPHDGGGGGSAPESPLREDDDEYNSDGEWPTLVTPPRRCDDALDSSRSSVPPSWRMRGSEGAAPMHGGSGAGGGSGTGGGSGENGGGASGASGTARRRRVTYGTPSGAMTPGLQFASPGSAQTPPHGSSSGGGGSGLKRKLSARLARKTSWRGAAEHDGSGAASTHGAHAGGGAAAAAVTGMGAAELLAFVERSAPAAVCASAQEVARAVLLWLAPYCSAREKSLALEAAARWAWKLLAIDRSDKAALNRRRAALRAYLPLLVPAILACVSAGEAAAAAAAAVAEAAAPAAVAAAGGLHSSRAQSAARELQVEALDTLSQLARCLQARFCDHAGTVRAAVSPLLASGDAAVRACAASALAALALCDAGADATAAAAPRALAAVALEAHALLHQAWPDTDVNMGGVMLDSDAAAARIALTRLLPPLPQEDVDDVERCACALARRLPALVNVLCRLLARHGAAAAAAAHAAAEAAADAEAATAAPAKSAPVEPHAAAETAAAAVAATAANWSGAHAVDEYQCLVLALAERVLRMGAQVAERCCPGKDELAAALRAGLPPPSVSSRALPRVAPGALSAAAARAALPPLQHAAATMLLALVSAPAPLALQRRTCACLAQYAAAMPVKGGIRETAFAALAAALRAPAADDAAAAQLTAAVAPLLISELKLLVTHVVDDGKNVPENVSRTAPVSRDGKTDDTHHPASHLGDGTAQLTSDAAGATGASATAAAAAADHHHQTSTSTADCNHGHGAAVDVATAAAGARALGALAAAHDALLSARARGALEAALRDGLLFLVDMGEALSAAAASAMADSEAPPPLAPHEQQQQQQRQQHGLSGEDRGRALSGPVFGGIEGDAGGSSVGVGGGGAAPVRAAAAAGVPVGAFPAAREALIGLAAQYLAAHRLSDDAPLHALAKAAMVACARDVDAHVAAAARDGLAQLGVERRPASFLKAANVLGITLQQAAPLPPPSVPRLGRRLSRSSSRGDLAAEAAAAAAAAEAPDAPVAPAPMLAAAAVAATVSRTARSGSDNSELTQSWHVRRQAYLNTAQCAASASPPQLPCARRRSGGSADAAADVAEAAAAAAQTAAATERGRRRSCGPGA